MCFHDPPRSWSNLQTYPSYSPASRTPSPVIRTPRSDPDHIPAFPTMNSPAHSIPKLSMKWTPSLIHPNKGTSGELNCSHSACGPPITSSSFATQTKHIPNPKDLFLQAQHHKHMHNKFLSLGNTSNSVQ